MTILFWVLKIAGILIIISIIEWYIDSIPKRRIEAQKKKERWGEFITQSVSGEYWDLGRTMMEVINGKRPDSRPYLESLGFTFLGYANEALLWVEPPKGWYKKHTAHPLWTEIFDENRTLRFKFFYKNDIMNPSDYRAHVVRV